MFTTTTRINRAWG